MNIAHIPGSHPYVRAIDPSGVRRCDDWDVSEMEKLGVDLVHVHFGFERFAIDELEQWIRVVERHGIHMVHTVHDIDNPHLVDQRSHHERTRLLVERADDVITLTSAAATAIFTRWNRKVSVIAHPPLGRHQTIAAARTRRPLMWLGTMRPNIDREIVESIVRTPDASIDVAIRSEGWEVADEVLRRALSAAASAGRIALSIIERPSDTELDSRIAAAGVLILPYRWGTHSGLVELAACLGVPTATTPTGCREDQGAVVATGSDLLACARLAAHSPRFVRRGPSAAEVRTAHRRFYSSIVAGTTAPT